MELGVSKHLPPFLEKRRVQRFARSRPVFYEDALIAQLQSVWFKHRIPVWDRPAIYSCATRTEK